MTMDQIRKVESLLQEKKDKTGQVLLAKWTTKDEELWEDFRNHMFDCWGSRLQDCVGIHPLTTPFLLYKEKMMEAEASEAELLEGEASEAELLDLLYKEQMMEAEAESARRQAQRRQTLAEERQRNLQQGRGAARGGV